VTLPPPTVRPARKQLHRTATTEHQSLTYIVKVTQGCNLGCHYCIAEPYLDRQRTPTLEIQRLARLVSATRATQPSLQLILHGGEPLLPGKQYWRELLEAVTTAAGDDLRLRLSVQTNGTRLDAEFAELLAQFKVGVGLTVDGPAPIHDLQRPNLAGRGSYAAIPRAVALLHAAGIRPGALCVVTPLTMQEYPDPGDLLDFFHTLGVTNFDLKPMLHEDLNYLNFTSWLCRAFDAWTERDDPGVRVRTLVDAVRRSLGQRGNTCTANGSCDTYLTLMPNGDIHGCDRWVTPKSVPIARLPPFVGARPEAAVEDVVRRLRTRRCGTHIGCTCGSTCPYEHSIWGARFCEGERQLAAHVEAWLTRLQTDAV
jgi:uncharacterized protein